MAKILDGKATSAEIRGEVAQEVAEMGRKDGVVPGLAAILVGEDPASAVYVRNKEKACDEVGIYTETFQLPRDTSQGDLLELVCSLNGNPRFHGILLQLPLPEHIDENFTLAHISPDKDVDSIHPMNLGKLALGEYDFMPATPGGRSAVVAAQRVRPLWASRGDMRTQQHRRANPWRWRLCKRWKAPTPPSPYATQPRATWP